MKRQKENQKLTIRDRLLLFLENIGESQEDFFRKTGLSNGFLKQKQCSINSDNLKKISEIYTDLNLEWLITEEGCSRKPVSGYSNMTIKLKGKERVVEVPIEQVFASMGEMVKDFYTHWNDIQNKIQLQDKKISSLEKKMGHPPKKT